MNHNIRHVQTSLLNIACEERGPASGYPVLLLHGWPDDVRTWDGVAAHLNAAGYRTITPYLRGFGPTRFLSQETMRSGQLSALGSDIIELAQALNLERFALVGHDWGARTAYVVGSEYAEHISHMVTISVGYGTNDPGRQLSFQQARNYWYHWYFCLPRGVEMLKISRRELCQFMWESWSPTWQHSNVEFDETADSFDNPDWVDITIHSYCHRWGYAEGDPRYDALEHRLAVTPLIRVPTLVLHGGEDAVSDPATSMNKEHFFTDRYERRVLQNVGHFPQREDPQAVADEVLRWLNG